MNGCDEPLPAGRGLRTVLGTEIRQCPFKHVHGRVQAWFGAYGDGACETPYHHKIHMAPVLVEAVGFIKATRDRIDRAEHELRASTNG